MTAASRRHNDANVLCVSGDGAGVEHVLRLEDELRRLRARMDALERELKQQIREAHRQYRRA